MATPRPRKTDDPGELLADQVRSLDQGQRDWVLFWLALSADERDRNVLAEAIERCISRRF